MEISEGLAFHEQSWLRYQERIIIEDSETLKRDLLERQEYHRDRYCDLQGNEILNEIPIKLLPGGQLGI